MIIPMSQMKLRGPERFRNLPEDTQQGSASASGGTVYLLGHTLHPASKLGIANSAFGEALAPAGSLGAGSPASSTASRWLPCRDAAPSNKHPCQTEGNDPCHFRTPEICLRLPVWLPLSSASPGRRRDDEEQPIDVWRSADVSLATEPALLHQLPGPQLRWLGDRSPSCRG